MNDQAVEPISETFLTRREALQGMVTLAAASLLSPHVSAESSPAPSTIEPEQPFNAGWRFHRGDVQGAETPGFDDSSWRTLDVPHDWSIEDVPHSQDDAPADRDRDAIWSEGTAPVRVGPFDVYASEGQGSTGWVVGGIGWYRKVFQAPTVRASGKVEVRFEGVYRNADVWINGYHLGNHPCGYTGFAFDLTPHLKDGANTLAVRVSNTGRNSRWYSGSGIFRKVWLSMAGPVRIPQHGISVTMPEVSTSSAIVRIETIIENGTGGPMPATVRVRLIDPQGAVAAETQTATRLAANTRTLATSSLTVKDPRLWSPDHPNLYRAEIAVDSGRTPADASSVALGIRTVEVHAARGLRINGQSIKLKGGCVHHDNGPLGSACIPRAEERRVELLKANGFNAIRTSHNPPSRDFLDACDRLGMLVIDEAFDCWAVGKTPEDYHLSFNDWWQRDLEAMILRDRNHPCVIFWSIGNEIPERAEPRGIELGKQLAAFVHTLDPSRPVTAAICGPWDHAHQSWQDMQPAFTYLDIGGYNYQWKSYEPDHAAFPQRVMMGTESFPSECFQNWSAIDTSPWVIGDFVWTAIDYLGESGIGNASLAGEGGKPVRSPFYPWFNAYCGDIDLIGNKKPQSYFRDVVWGRSKVEMAVQRPVPSHYSEIISKWGWSDELRGWTFPGLEGNPLKVRVYTRGDEVRLFHNGNQVGQKLLAARDALTAEFDVPYSPGELKAVAFEQDREIGSLVFTTTGKPSRVVLAGDRPELRASRDDLAYVMVTVVDDAGRTVPDATIPVSFSVRGAGELAAVGNANPKDVASFRQPRRSTFHGACLAILRPAGGSGSITLNAEAPGLEAASITLNTVADRLS